MTSAQESIQAQLAEAVKQQQSGQPREALRVYQSLLKQFPGHPHLLYLSGLVYQDLDDLQSAMESLSRATVAEPTNGLFHLALGIVLKKRGNSRAALERLLHSCQNDPNNAEIHFHLGDTCMDLGAASEALPHFRAAIRLRPRFQEAWINLGLCLKACRLLHEALMCFQQVIDDHPQNSAGHINLGLTYLLMGDYARGWQEYEWRLRLEGEEISLDMPALRQHGQALPRWDGSSLAGKTILVLSEQGFGDTLQFVRYLERLKIAGARVLLTAPAALLPLLRTVPAIDRILPLPRLSPQVFQDQMAIEQVDWFCPLVSLPLLVGTRVDSIPVTVPYVQPDTALVRKWREHFRVFFASCGANPPVRIGLVWRGKPLHKDDPLRRRSCTLKDLAPLATVANVALFSLQKEEPQPLQPPPGMVITDLQNELHDFAHTAAILATLDLLISIDTSVAHLGGALGKPVWVLLPFVPDWRWSLDQETTPWYPTLRLFRQTVANCWREPVQQMVAALPLFMASKMEPQ